MRPATLSLESQDSPWRCVLAPPLGSGCVQLQARGDRGWVDVGRPADLAGPAAADPFEFASFPLVPYPNRIADGRVLALRSAASSVRLPRNDARFAHPLHGTGWLRRWEVGSVSACGVSLHLSEPAGADWPWAFEAEQRITLDGDTIRFELRLSHRGQVEMPAGIGWHPYFVRDPDTQILLRVGCLDEADATGLPTRRVPVGPEWPQTLVDLDVLDGFDNGLVDWDGKALLRWPSRGVAVQLRTTPSMGRHCVLYTPSGAPYFCVEPVSHANNTLGMTPEAAAANGLRWLAPGETLSGSMSLSVHDLTEGQS